MLDTAKKFVLLSDQRIGKCHRSSDQWIDSVKCFVLSRDERIKIVQSFVLSSNQQVGNCLQC